MSLHDISKSRYLSGTQCLKKLYLEKFRKDLKPEVNFSQQALFDQGHSVGELAQLRFCGGKDASPESYFDFSSSVKNTKDWIVDGEPIIYEAAFVFEKTLAALDIYIKQGNETYAIEVKSSTQVKDYHIIDGALQYWVMTNAGFKPDKFFLMHLNNQYIKEGKLDLEKLFTLTDITDQILALQSEVPRRLEEMRFTLAIKTEPVVDIGPHCSTPFTCDFIDYCWGHIPDNSIFEISRISNRAWEYYNRGILSIEDIPEEDTFSKKQMVQINGVKTGDEFINIPFIKEWVNTLEYPLYFFDFETINPSIPLYESTRPYQQIPVQYSLHVLRTPESELEHFEFLADFDDDPRPALTKRMLSELGTKGHIVAYNIGFEKGKIAALSSDFPDFSEELLALNERFVDLMTPFQKGWYYNPAMKGSYSIKAVLPALINDSALSYSGLNISNGGDASVYLAALGEQRIKAEDIPLIRNDLLEYCKLDTLAMVKLLEKLIQL